MAKYIKIYLITERDQDGALPTACLCMPEPGIWAQPSAGLSTSALETAYQNTQCTECTYENLCKTPSKEIAIEASECIWTHCFNVNLCRNCFHIWWQSMTKPLRTSGGHRWQVHLQKILGWIFGPSTICTLLPSSEVHPQIPMVTIPECQRRAMSQKSWWAYTRSWLPRNILYMLIWQATKNILL